MGIEQPHIPYNEPSTEDANTTLAANEDREAMSIPESSLSIDDIRAIILECRNGNTEQQHLLDDAAAQMLINSEWKTSLIDFNTIEILKAVGEDAPRDLIQEDLPYFTGLGDQTAIDIIDAERGDLVVKNLTNFTNLTFSHDELMGRIVRLSHSGRMHPELKLLEHFTDLGDETLLALIVAGSTGAQYVFDNFDRFSGLKMTHNELIQLCLNYHYHELIADNLEKFTKLTMTHDELAETFINHGSAAINVLLANLKKFTKLTMTHDELVRRAIKQGAIGQVIHAYDRLPDLTITQDELVEIMIEKGNWWELASLIDKLDNLTITQEELVEKFVVAGKESYLALHLKEWTELQWSPNQLIQFFLEHYPYGHYDNYRDIEDTLRSILNRYSDLGDDVASTLITQGYSGLLFDNLDRFTRLTLSDDELALRTIRSTHLSNFFYYKDKLPDLTFTDDELVKKILDRGDIGRETIRVNIDSLQSLSNATAQILINSVGAIFIAQNITHFTDLGDSIFNSLIDEGYIVDVVNNLKHFGKITISPDELVEKLISVGKVQLIDRNFKWFSSMSDESIQRLLDVGMGRDIIWRIEDLTNLHMSHDELAKRCIKVGLGVAVAGEIMNFTNLSPATLVQLPLPTGVLLAYQEKQANSALYTPLVHLVTSTHLRTNELLPTILELDNISADSIIAESWPTVADISPAQPLLDRGLTPSQLLQFADRDYLSRHDAFLAGNDIALLIDQSGLSARDFFQRIMLQVTQDDAIYDAGTAHHHFNQLANRRVVPLATLHEQITTYPEDIQSEAKEVLSAFESDDDIFASWRTLKAYVAKSDLIVNGQATLRTLSELRTSGKDALAEWYAIVSSSTNVDTNALTDFLTKPDKFFEREATYTPVDLHDAKKPSNYFKIPYLDLTADELRDALVEGALDKIAALPPFEVRYTIAPEGKYLAASIAKLPLRERTSLYLGSQRNNVTGLANDTKKLFHTLNQYLKQRGVTLQEVLTGDTYLDQALSTELEKILSETPLNSSLVVDRGDEYIATMHSKSSPQGVLAGNDTACCMPFGDGKANVYLMNPACTQFTIQKERVDGTRRTLVQSVMSLNLPIPGHTIPKVLERMQNTSNSLHELFPDEALLTTQQPLLVADNAESNPNFANNPVSTYISEVLYADFFARYLAQEALADVSHSEVQIGKDFTKTLAILPLVPNQSVPVAPMSYSDNTQDESYQLIPRLARPGVLQAAVSEQLAPVSGVYKRKSGLSSLTYQDTLATAYLESKAYQDVPNLLAGLNDMENGLIAKDINNSLKERAELSVKYIGDDGAFRSYILAYEGKRWAEEANEDERCIYISDFASNLEGNSAGFVLREFCKRYKAAYLDTRDPVPLFAEMRESTSYALFMKHQRLMERWLGVSLHIDELGIIDDGEHERRHVVKIRPVLRVNTREQN